MIRRALAALAVVAVGLGLAGCVQDAPADALHWLAGQAGVVTTEVISQSTDISGTSGSVRGELDPTLSEKQLAGLVDSVQGYLSRHGDVSIQLGRGGIDFLVTTADDSTANAQGLWSRVVDIAAITNALVTADEVHARTVRPQMADALSGLGGLGVSVRLEGFVDASSIPGDAANDDFFGSDYANSESLELYWPSGCDPDEAQQVTAASFFENPEVEGGQLDLCSGFRIAYLPDVALSIAAPALREATGSLDQLTVTAVQAVGAAPDGREVAINVPDVSAFELLVPFDQEGAPDAFYTLSETGAFEVVDYEVLAADLVAVVATAPYASQARGIRIEGGDVAVSGSLAELPGLVEAATALAAANPEFANIELSVPFGLLALSSPVATDPDISAAVAALRASGATEGRTFTITYLQTQVDVAGGIATVADQYTDGHVVQAFADEWNATAP